MRNSAQSRRASARVSTKPASRSDANRGNVALDVPTLDISKILQAAFVGIIAGLTADLGVAAAGGEPVTELDVWANIVTGSIAGMVGEIILELGGGALVVAIVSPFLSGFFFQLLFPPAPEPPLAAEAQPA